MGKPRRKRKAKIKFRQSAKIVQKNDATRVARPDTIGMRRMQAQAPRSVAPVFRVKLRKK